VNNESISGVASRDRRVGKVRDLTERELIDYGQARFPEKRLFILSNWMMLDVLLPTVELEQLEASGCQALMLYGQSVVYDSEGLVPVGESIMTGFLCAREFRILESDTAAFILIGQGGSKDIFPQSASALKSPEARKAAGLVVHDV